MRFLICLFLFVLPAISFAKLQLPSVISNGMVLQQDTEVKIWGSSDTEDLVVIKPSWSDRTYRAYPGKDGRWSVKIETLKADFKQYTLTISQKGETISLEGLMFGEVWLCTGQSNMEMKMKGYYGKPIIGGRKAIADGGKYDVHIFEVPKASLGSRQFDCKAKWQAPSPQAVANISAAAYFFGKQLFETLNVPVGLVVAPWGGASVLAFMSDDAFVDFPQFKLPPKQATNLGNMAPTGIFNGMIHPILGYTIKGCIWYQGETDRKTPDLYRKLYASMLRDWRKKWEIGDFPMVYAQIAPFDYPDGNSAYLREAQMKCQEENSNTFMISLMDVGERHDIHPSNKEIVGFRMAMKALDKVYNISGISSAEPLYKSHRIEGSKVVLTFKNAENGLTTYGKPLTGFAVAGADRVFYPAVAKLKKTEIVVYSDKVAAPVAVRYAFTDYAEGCLFNVEGCCASSFRTDTWAEESCKFEN